MRQIRYALETTLVLALLLFGAGSVQAQNSTFSVGAFGGAGGSPDSDNFTGGGFQLLASMNWAPRTNAQLRFGTLEVGLDADTSTGVVGIVDTDLRYLTIGTEYTSNADYYEAGVVIGLGFYDLDGSAAFAGQSFLVDDDALGLFLATTGDFRINSRWSVLVELSGHYADLDAAQIFLMGHVGVGFRF